MNANSARSMLIRSQSQSSFTRLVFEAEHATAFGIKDRSVFFRCCQCFVIVIRMVTPFSYFFLLVLWCYDLWPRKMTQGPFSAIFYITLVIWMVIEALFFPYYYYLFSKMSENMNENLKHLASEPESRMRLFQKCFEAMRFSAIGAPILATDSATGKCEQPAFYLRQVRSHTILRVFF